MSAVTFDPYKFINGTRLLAAFPNQGPAGVVIVAMFPEPDRAGGRYVWAHMRSLDAPNWEQGHCRTDVHRAMGEAMFAAGWGEVARETTFLGDSGTVPRR